MTNKSVEYTFPKAHFQELLADETRVDVAQLREAARYGVPSSVRGAVWKVLMGVDNPDKSDEIATQTQMEKEFNALSDERSGSLSKGIVRRIRQGLVEFFTAEANAQAFARDWGAQLRCERLLRTYLAHHQDVEYTDGLVHELAPIMLCVKKAHEQYFCFCSLREFIAFNIAGDQLRVWLAQFLGLFRSFSPDLYSYFCDQELNPNEWALEWVQHMLAKNLPLKCVLRLWDTYLASSKGFHVHMFVCLAILQKWKAVLMEFDYSELRVFLATLPPMDMDRLIRHAFNMYEECSEKQLL